MVIFRIFSLVWSYVNDSAWLLINRFAIYAKLGVPEIWRYDGQVISIYYLVSDRYVLSDHSLTFPLLKTSGLQNFLELKSTLKENALIRQVREWAAKLVCS